MVSTKKGKGVIFLFLTFLLHTSNMAQEVLRPRPLCLSQYTLANRACALVRRVVVPVTSDGEELPEEDERQRSSTTHTGHHRNSSRRHDEHGHNHGRNEHAHEGNGHNRGRNEHAHEGNGHKHGRNEHGHAGNGHKHRGQGHQHEDGRRRRGQRHQEHHRRRRRGHHDALTAECCRWLREVDSECVCDILVRLPVFLTVPQHSYLLQVGDNCTVAYNCTTH